MTDAAFADSIKSTIRTIPDFPKKGILFRDITPLLLDGHKFHQCVNRLAALTDGDVDYVVSIESRGFIFGSALAYALGAGFVPIRKEGRLPHAKFQATYDLEYGRATVEIHSDALAKGARALVVDDVLATGGTVQAAVDLVRRCGATISGLFFLVELSDLGAREKLRGLNVHSLVRF